ncbi:hypothetical protein JD844_016469 [Phrynosoma platyrhinos]|uniref:DUF1279 domain-containing protein n=1 Tax=Phrynosoma platyrhinos TaxID=52577 RepID=A0ABQ7SKN2_PHRPL|nr:hypothetical protein JD844_016469 [Phrynosoma platyrhinos]
MLPFFLSLKPFSFNLKDTDSQGKVPPQPENPHNKELKRETPATPTENLAQEAPVESNSVELDPLQDKFSQGINVVPFLEFIGLPESVVNILKHSQSGNALTAYAMYKIATPARYTVTLGGTSITVKYLRRHGHMSTPPPVKDYIQDRMEETKERLSGKMEETRGMISGKMEETKERLTGKMEETKDKITEKIQETKDKVSFIKKKE